MHVSEEKKALREAIEQRISATSTDDRMAESRSLCKVLSALIPPHATICGYYPLKTEVDVRPFLMEHMNGDGTVYLPRFESGEMIFRHAYNLDDLIVGAFNIPEPPEQHARLVRETLDIVLVPGRAFDRTGMRLGRGNGGYDQWIRAQRLLRPSTVLYGISFECQLVHDVPHESHDEKLDGVITARGLIEC